MERGRKGERERECPRICVVSNIPPVVDSIGSSVKLMGDNWVIASVRYNVRMSIELISFGDRCCVKSVVPSVNEEEYRMQKRRL